MASRIDVATTQAEVARQMGLSTGTVAKWWPRYQVEGRAGQVDRSSRPQRSPRRTAAKVEERICRLRRSSKRSPAYLSARTGVPQATVRRVPKHHGLNRLVWIDRPTGKLMRRYERSAAGELVHLDVKKVGRVPAGGAGGCMAAEAQNQMATPLASCWPCAARQMTRVSWSRVVRCRVRSGGCARWSWRACCCERP